MKKVIVDITEKSYIGLSQSNRIVKEVAGPFAALKANLLRASIIDTFVTKEGYIRYPLCNDTVTRFFKNSLVTVRVSVE